VSRGAEVAFTAVASELARAGDCVTMIGSGQSAPSVPYRYLRAPLIPREKFERYPKGWLFRGETVWEEASFLPGMLRLYQPQDYDVTLACSYPFVNWGLRARRHRGRRPAHVFVTQNGDWPARSNVSEFRLFGCDGLVCTNPDYFNENCGRYTAALIPNGVDLQKFSPGPPVPASFGLPDGPLIVLMVSALIESKMVSEGIEAVSKLPGVHLVVAGDGPLRSTLLNQAHAMMPGRYHNLTVNADEMPDLYRSASVFLHLSRDESFGNVFVEAMACGIPTVAWNSERTRWITGNTALLVTKPSSDALAAGIAQALRGHVPQETLTSRASQYSWPSVAALYREFLEKVSDRWKSEET
jgi:glycosyltransferase involved in cell wall biosynthesis